MANPEYAQLAVDATFDVHGRDAIYTAPGGGESVPCRVLVGRKDTEIGGFSGRPIAAGGVIKVRKTEVPVPLKEGAFIIANGPTMMVADSPRCDDDERLVWSMTVS